MFREKLKKMLKFLIIIILILLVVLVIFNPSKSSIEDWIYENYGYKCDEYGVCQKNNTEVLVMGQHYRNAGIFMSVERSIEKPNSNNGETVTIRGFGISKKIYTVEDNWFWEIVN